ncbi:hypothetical protein P7E02_12545 [Enterococcus hulanensis]|uniref:phage tail assembly chaperone G n=1 Tax=Enterococcus hulanensis TaxID=2559929 RepID=UPI00288DA2B7|nr:hypothetical protein [Enterococcus hulanensis]MDT2660703.1 hypothetical protein [Enterococcus hulanensis]
MLEIKNEELRLSVTVKGKKKTYVQSKIPMKRVLEYSEGEIDLFAKAIEEGREGATENEVLDFRIGFVAKLFDDDDVTKEMLLEELDANEKEVVFDIINYRVLGNEKNDAVSGTDPKD